MEIWHNPRCSKSRATLALLQEHGVEPTVRRYLDDPPTRAELERALVELGTEDPLALTRTGEPAFREQGLKGADRETLLDALAAQPKLIERPLVRSGDRAVLGRPPENVLALLDARQ
ncbi:MULTISPECIES: arsenate reductase (glutaredoxin) [Pseudonocardia]|uniref:Arsenate reductase n=2 Tax=Pseudonocardia TaxID=1847 RepID=A0A1Y2MWB7_PSEAH|nr:MULTISPECIES: arsenate reductase (glutaredoxin) [Pseudonocardia]OSY39484.1 Arsenate reductase [Pseudonocardia autotrophica]TDN75278.1 arsenate reductase [Pseudonocardia autotrophica]BBF99224.1 arsenate reductase [Pseudonocardia autotrophica]GEC24770.1 arsenate reductase [Pseudonocardia saturnea]